MSKEVHRIYFCKDGAILDTQIREGEDVTDTLKRCFKKISDLEAKLVEKDKAIENWQTMYESVMQTCHNDKEEIERLNKQLAEKDDEITQRLVIQERDYDQDKISFAVEQLEKVKEYWLKHEDVDWYIDNQIKQLKEHQK